MHPPSPLARLAVIQLTLVNWLVQPILGASPARSCPLLIYTSCRVCEIQACDPYGDRDCVQVGALIGLLEGVVWRQLGALLYSCLRQRYTVGRCHFISGGLFFGRGPVR